VRALGREPEASLGDVPRRAEGEQERALARGPDARDFVERAFDELALAPGAMGADGVAVGFLAQARRRGATLFTLNTREFERVPGLSVEEWSA
jgi:hypothetical protein